MSINFEAERYSMVMTKLKTRGIVDSTVIAAMLRIPREKFVPDSEKDRSYADGPLSIGFGQTISQPYIVAYMSELLELEGNEKILEIGTGSGYQTAVLAEISEQVYTIEVIPELSKKAKALLTGQMGYGNVHYRIGNGREGWPEFSPYDRIILTAAPGAFPARLFEQLKENGMAISPVGDYFQKIIQYRKTKSKIEENHLIGVSFVPLV
jgi:protein-L-isoaspartate(D-aspartate) O-methyltransferase